METNYANKIKNILKSHGSIDVCELNIESNKSKREYSNVDINIFKNKLKKNSNKNEMYFWDDLDMEEKNKLLTNYFNTKNIDPLHQNDIINKLKSNKLNSPNIVYNGDKIIDIILHNSSLKKNNKIKKMFIN